MKHKITNDILGSLPTRIRRLMAEKQVIGVGKNRVVYDLGNGYVLKVAKNPQGIRHNRREIETYQYCAFPVRRHLARISDHGNGWLMMRRHSRKLPQTIKYKQRLRRLVYQFRRAGINPIDMFYRPAGTVKHKNLRIRKNGAPVVIDYGAFKLLSEIKNP